MQQIHECAALQTCQVTNSLMSDRSTLTILSLGSTIKSGMAMAKLPRRSTSTCHQGQLVPQFLSQYVGWHSRFWPRLQHEAEPDYGVALSMVYLPVAVRLLLCWSRNPGAQHQRYTSARRSYVHYVHAGAVGHACHTVSMKGLSTCQSLMTSLLLVILSATLRRPAGTRRCTPCH